MIQLTEEEIINLAENLKSTIIRCQEENSYLLESLCRTTTSKACGDVGDVNLNGNSSNTNLQSVLTREEYLSELIKIKTQENSTLRESNVKLKHESKIQDQKIRDLNRNVLLQRRMTQKSESQREIIGQLKALVDEKSLEVRQLGRNLGNIKSVLVKEQNKLRIFQERQRAPAAKKKSNVAIKSKLESLLVELNELKIDEELKKILCSSHNFNEIIEKALKRLVFIKSTIENEKMKNEKISIEKVQWAQNIKRVTNSEKVSAAKNLKSISYIDKEERKCGDFTDNSSTVKLKHRRTKSF